MTQLLRPVEITKTSDKKDKIMLEWTNPNKVDCGFELRFSEKKNPASFKVLKGIPFIGKKDGKYTATLTYPKDVEITDPEKYYAQVRATPKSEAFTASEWSRETVWTVDGSLALEVAGKDIVFYSDKDVDPDLYQGEVDLSAHPVTLNAVVNSVLGTFDLNLPDKFPTFTFYRLSGFLKTSAPKGAGLEAWTTVKFPNPFGLKSEALVFDKMKLAVDVQEKSKLVSFSANVLYNSESSSITFGSAIVVLGETRVIGLEIESRIAPAEVIGSMLGIEIPALVKSFLPVFKPESRDKPIRLYNASKDYTYHGLSKNTVFHKGFNLDQLIIEVLGYDFYVSLQVADEGFTLTAHPPDIDFFDVFTIRNYDRTSGIPGAELQVNSKKDSVQLKGEMLFFPKGAKETLDFTFHYQDKKFVGEIEYQKKILNVDKPKLGFEWSDHGGFKITKYPVDMSQLQAALDWAKQLKDLGNKVTGCEQACGEILDMAFNETITTRFDFKYKMAPGDKPGKVGVELSGSYIVSVLGKDITISLDNPLILYLDIPKGFDDLANALIKSLLGAVVSIAECLWNNKVKLGELLLMLTFKAGIQSAEAAACRLGCQAGEKVMEKALQAALEAAAQAVAEAAAQAGLEAAAAVVAALTGLIKLLESFIDWITGKAAEKKKEKEKKEAERDAAKQKIKKYLTVKGFSIEYKEDGVGRQRIHAEWDDIAEKPKTGTVSYELVIACPNKNGDVASKTFSIERKDQKRYTFDIPKEYFTNGKTCDISINAVYARDETYRGEAVHKPLSIPILQTPVPQKSLDWNDEAQKRLGTIDVKWENVSIAPPNMTRITRKGYVIELHNLSDKTVLFQKDLTENSYMFKLYDETDPKRKPFFPDPDHEYQVWVTAKATDPDLDSLVGQSEKFRIPWGINYMRIGYNFKVGKDKTD